MLGKKKELEIPVYLFMGFLEAGKTTFIQETLEEGKAFLGIQVGITKHFFDLRSLNHKYGAIALFHPLHRIRQRLGKQGIFRKELLFKDNGFLRTAV